MRYGQTADYDHPHTFLETFLASSPQNATGWHDDAFERTLARAGSSPNPDESIGLYREAERIALDAMPRIPLYFHTRSSLVKPWVKGFGGSTRSPHAIQDLSIDPAWQRDTADAPAASLHELPPPGAFHGQESSTP